MNFLAHSYLSCGSDDLLIGNFIADFIKNREVVDFSFEIQEGIKLHRAIDYYTDNHSKVKESVRRLRPTQRKYAPVVMDVIFDYLLANNWKRYSGVTLEDFASQVYDILTERIDELPAKLQRILPAMISNRFLEAYGDYSGLRFSLEKMNQRTSFPSDFPAAIAVLQENESIFNDEFNSFFPDVIAFVDAHYKC